jgi:hypothetical protein
MRPIVVMNMCAMIDLIKKENLLLKGQVGKFFGFLTIF